LTSEPQDLYSGDSKSWSVTLSNYPASEGWALTYYFSQAGETPTPIPTTPVGDDYLVSLTPQLTGLMNPGKWSWVSRVAKGSELITVDRGSLKILPDPSKPYDSRSHAEKALEAITATLEGRLTESVTEYTIDGVMCKHMTHEELLKLHMLYKAMVRRGLGKPGVRGIPAGSIFRVR